MEAKVEAGELVTKDSTVIEAKYDGGSDQCRDSRGGEN